MVIVSNYGPTTYTADNSVDNTNANVPTYLKGSVTFAPGSNMGIEYETPFYTNNLFVFAFSKTLDGGQNSTDDDMETSWVRLHQVAFFFQSATTQVNWNTDIATGEDFTLMRFCGSPYYSHT